MPSGEIPSIIENLGERLQAGIRGLEDRPFVTVSYAQSIDGSIAEFPDHPLSLSGELSLSLTHAIRAAHGAILVGIGTVLADNPALTVRYAAGENPQPVILDSRLRFPLFSPMLENPVKRPWIFTNGRADQARMSTLRNAGAEIFTASAIPDGNLDLMAVLRKLREMGILSVLVEGGAQVITSFLASRLIDQFIITIAPVLIGGVRAFETGRRINPVKLPKLGDLSQQILGEDIVIIGKPTWN